MGAFTLVNGRASYQFLFLMLVNFRFYHASMARLG